MVDLLAKAVGLLMEHPEMGAALAAAMVVAFLCWGVISTSHRYR